MKRLKEVSSKQENLYLFDAFSAMCSNSKCEYTLDGKPLYRDDDHFSNSSSYEDKPIELDARITEIEEVIKLKSSINN